MRTRTLMAAFIMAAYVFVALATVLYSGALALESIFGVDTNLGIWLIGILAGGLHDLRRAEGGRVVGPDPG